MKIIKYGSSWCGPCRATSEALKSSGISYEEVDVDSNPEALEGKNVRSIPYIEILDDTGNIIDTHIGPMTLPELNILKEKFK